MFEPDLAVTSRDHPAPGREDLADGAQKQSDPPPQWPVGPKPASAPLPYLEGDAVTRFLCRTMMSRSSKGGITVLSGLEHIAITQDPFIAVANHSQRLEAVLIPATLLYHRQGKRVHFLADWPMMLVPGVGFLYRRGQVIPVFGKSAKPAFMNIFRPLLEKPGSAWQRAAEKLRAGSSVGVFPEGTMNRDPHRLLRGRAGAARLAIEERVPVVPIGVRFPRHQGSEPIADGEPMAIEIGAALEPPAFEGDEKAPRDLVRTFQVRIMEQLSRLSGKSWQPSAPRRRFDGS